MTTTFPEIENTWGKKKVPPVKPMKQRDEMKMSRTLHLKIKFFEYIEKEGWGNNGDGTVNYNEGFNQLCQMGIAWNEQEKFKNQTKIQEDV